MLPTLLLLLLMMLVLVRWVLDTYRWRLLFAQAVRPNNCPYADARRYQPMDIDAWDWVRMCGALEEEAERMCCIVDSSESELQLLAAKLASSNQEKDALARQLAQLSAWAQLLQAHVEE